MSIPYGAEDLLRDLRTVGVTEGDSVIVHTSLKAFDWITGDSRAVITALCQAVGATGNIVMPSQTPELSDPSLWTEGPEPAENWEPIRQKTLGYSPRLTPVIGQSRVAELFRNYPGVERSSHPLESFTAWGSRAKWLTTITSYDFPFGDDGPLGKLYQLGAKIILIGTDFETNTSLHLAETHLNQYIKVTQETAPVETGDLLHPAKELVSFQDVELETYDFLKLEREFMAEQRGIRQTPLHKGILRAIDMRTCVDFAEKRFKTYKYIE